MQTFSYQWKVIRYKAQQVSKLPARAASSISRQRDLEILLLPAN